MKGKFVTLIAFASSFLLTSGNAGDRRGSPAHRHAAAISGSEQHAGSNHSGPGGFKPEFENESVEVIRVTIGPHEELPMHDLTPRVVVLLTDQNLRVTFPNGETKEEHHKAGEAIWVSAQRHAGENLSDKASEFIAVIPKQK